MSNKETRVSNDMRRAQAETVPEERLKHMASSPAHIMQSSAPVSLRSGELRGMAEEILASRQALRSTPVEAEPVAWVDPRSLADLQERKRWTTAILIDKPGENATTPLYAHPLPNPSPSDGEVRLPTREEAAQAANVLMKCNGHDLDVWTEGEWPVDADDWLRPLASRKSVQSNESSTKDEQEGLDEAIAKVEGQFPGAFWHLAKGRLSAGEPMFGFQALFGPDEIMAEGEGDSAVAAISAALQSKRGQP